MSPYQDVASQRLTKPGPATSARSTSSSPAACSASSSASSRGWRFFSGASRRATFVAKSPCSGFEGRSRATGAPTTSPSRSASSSSALAGNGLARGEELFESPQLVGAAGRDQHVAYFQRIIRRGSRVEAAVLLAERDDDRSGLVSDPQVPNRLAALAGSIGDDDLLVLEVVRRPWP